VWCHSVSQSRAVATTTRPRVCPARELSLFDSFCSVLQKFRRDQPPNLLRQFPLRWNGRAVLHPYPAMMVDLPQRGESFAAQPGGIVLGLLVWQSVAERDCRHGSDSTRAAQPRNAIPVATLVL